MSPMSAGNKMSLTFILSPESEEDNAPRVRSGNARVLNAAAEGSVEENAAGVSSSSCYSKMKCTYCARTYSQNGNMNKHVSVSVFNLLYSIYRELIDFRFFSDPFSASEHCRAHMQVL